MDNPQARSRHSMRGSELLCILILILLPILLFRSHVFGKVTYIGNPDRLNSHLKILKLHVDEIAAGHLQAWSDYEMLGYDSFTMPYTFPNPLTYITYITSGAGARNLYITAGYISVTLLILSGLAAYAFIVRLTENNRASLIGSILYQFTAMSVLRVSQNDLSFAVLILIPLVALCIYGVTQARLVMNYCWLSFLLFVLLHFTFLQEAAYAMIFFGAYAAYRSFSSRAWQPVAVLASAALTATIGAFPRIYGIVRAFTQYTRSFVGVSLANFNDVYFFQNIHPYQMLRWFDNTIFGAFPSDAAVTLGNNINLTEGFLLYTCAFVPFLLIYTICKYQGSWWRLLVTKQQDAAFLFWFLMLTFSVIAFKPVTHLFYVAFFKVDFTHARFLIAGLLPLAAVMAIILKDLAPSNEYRLNGTQSVGVVLIALLIAGMIVGGIEWLADHMRGSFGSPFAAIPMRISRGAIWRISGSALIVAILLAALRFVRGGTVRLIAYQTMCYAIVFQTLLGADFQVNGEYTRSEALAFLWGNIYAAERQDFRPPSEAAIATLQRRVEGARFRSAVICPPDVTGTFCAGHVPEFWKLRVIDGYYGLGVPTRLTALPWRGAISLRTIGFRSEGELQWPLLGALNVKYAVVVNKNFYRNRIGTSGASTDIPEHVAILENPSRVVPRSFFTHSITTVRNAQEAARLMFEKDGEAKDVVATSYVEGWSGQRTFPADGTVVFDGSGDRIQLHMQPVNANRFLVLNELYFPGWEATVDDSPARIYPTNSFMRGVFVPAGTKNVTLQFVPFVYSTPAVWLYSAAIVLFLAGLKIFRRWEGCHTVEAQKALNA